MCDEDSDNNTILTSAGSRCANANASNVMMQSPRTTQLFQRGQRGEVWKGWAGIEAEREGGGPRTLNLATVVVVVCTSHPTRPHRPPSCPTPQTPPLHAAKPIAIASSTLFACKPL
ncbi:hypothetical protein HETIRDRAFT_420834 [Heterobasidion irregulare TC 32-1]|uniref:Uncharacterized protein n=1 Tax=Heterobasidion irregulare (strain TC 32-1) TaxID=747525 RepID=W4JYT5_HETIT|nr:uncharacterized protein HETIRDRAFT_420834 [Heterobasidion irregulare TC 32-1]ETW78031.1 hypothetical protein HETIRDRAFT_420834 [Heterobasidion irregulare TC 32-1]